MRKNSRATAAFFAAVFVISSLGGCGGGSRSTEADGSTAETAVTTSKAGEGSAAFRNKGGDNSIPDFGEEAPRSERDQAGTVLESYLDARSAHRWAEACAYMTVAERRSLEQLTSPSSAHEGKECPDALRSISVGVPSSGDASFVVSGVAALRVKGKLAFALFHGADGSDYMVPMSKEGDEWRLAAFAPSLLQ